MTRLLKWLHVVAAIGFVGSLAAALLLSLAADDSTSSALATTRRAISNLAGTLGLPSLVLLVLTGMLSMIRQPALIEARWVWAKVLLGVLVGGVALLVVQPAVGRAAALAQMALEGSPALGPLAVALRLERIGTGINLALSLAAVALAVWRPQFGRRHVP
jgi:hypothetical protein